MIGTHTCNYDQEYNGFPNGILTTDPWGLKATLRRQLLLDRSKLYTKSSFKISQLAQLLFQQLTQVAAMNALLSRRATARTTGALTLNKPKLDLTPS